MNGLRFHGRRGHVESYFLRLNDPLRPRALWLKQTILSPLEGPPVAESWLVWFDREAVIAERTGVPWAQAHFDPPHLKTSALRVTLGAEGEALREVAPVPFSLTWRASTSPAAAPMDLFPYRFLRTGPFPRSKLNTPHPWLLFDGRVELPGGEVVEVCGWHGMQGHNWGREHAAEYAWGQCVFPEDETMVEGFTGRARLPGNRLTPRLSALVVRRGARTYRFDRLFDPWRQVARLDDSRWEVVLRSADGEARLVMDSGDRPQACLGYRNPDGELRYCFNSKLAKTWLAVCPSDGARFVCESDHGGALEFLRGQPDARFPVV